MNKVEQYIKKHTKLYCNISADGTKTPWLTPDQARMAVEIAREEIYEWLRKISFDDYKVVDRESYRMGFPYDYIDVHGLINNLKQAMKDE